MKTSRFSVFMIIVLLVSLVLAACQPATQAPQAEKPLFVYVSPNPLGVNEFLKLGQVGLERAGAKYNAETKVLESEDPVTREENVRAAVNEGAKIVIVLGFEFNDIIPKVAAESSDTQFLIVDQCIDNPPPNVHCAVFKEYEAAFLIGAMAALLTKTNHVGTIGALDIPFLHRYTDGFAEGARYINPDIQVDTLWVGGDNPFSDPVRSKEQALAMANSGADHIFAATAGGNYGIFEAAKEKNFFSYGVDVNQCGTTPGYIVDNLLKLVDVALEQSVDAIMAGNTQNVQVYGVADKGIGLVATTSDDLKGSQCVIADYPEVVEKIKEIQDKIIKGEITIEDPMFKQ